MSNATLQNNDLLIRRSDTAVFDPNLPVTRMDANITGLADALYYGPRYFTEVLAKYPGPIIFGKKLLSL